MQELEAEVYESLKDTAKYFDDTFSLVDPTCLLRTVSEFLQLLVKTLKDIVVRLLMPSFLLTIEGL